MFLGIRDIVFAKGRFALIASVVGLITLLLVMLTGLTGGLGSQNTKVLEDINADRWVFDTSGGAEISFSNSSITAEQADAWATGSGVDAVTPVGVIQGNLEAETSMGVAVVGVPADSDLVTQKVGASGGAVLTPRDGELIISSQIAADTSADVGDTVTVSGQELTVAGISNDTFYSHTPVAWTSTATWQSLAHVPADTVGTVLAIKGTGDSADYEQLASATNTSAVSTRDAFAGLSAYSSENKSLVTMQGFLYGISALVTVSFLTVWTIQRTRDIAVLRALGASGSYLLKDALFQAAVVLATGALAGALLGWALGLVASGTVPFQLDASTVLVPAVGIWVLGIAGALIAVRRVAKTDPLLALGGN
ncbi:FtsX-like permease family protein [Rothia sp. ZJ932]|nr:FtsX-like permease family protein [Rothia sp. ZJ932]